MESTPSSKEDKWHEMIQEQERALDFAFGCFMVQFVLFDDDCEWAAKRHIPLHFNLKLSAPKGKTLKGVEDHSLEN